jgi:hypothetical protein
MLNLEVKVQGKRTETLVNALKLVIAKLELGEMREPLDAPILSKNGLNADGHVLAGLEGEPISYVIAAETVDGDQIVVNRGFTARSWAYASATNFAIKLRHEANCSFMGNKIRRIVLLDNQGKPLNEYNNSPELTI